MVTLADELNHGGAKGAGLALLRAISIQVPPTTVIALDGKRDTLQKFCADGDATRDWILRASPVVPMNIFPMLSGLYSSIRMSSPDEIYSAARLVADSAKDPVTLQRLRMLQLEQPRLVALLQPFLKAKLSGFVHAFPGGSYRAVWVNGHLSAVADGTDSGSQLDGNLNSPDVVTAHTIDGPRIAEQQSNLRRIVRGLAPLATVDEPVEVEWLLTPGGEFYCLQLQLLTKGALR